MDTTSLSPMMSRYLQTKEEYSDCILFYRLGDFYEMFFDDAITVSRELELTLTGKQCGLPERAPMCGVPYHSANTYIERLVQKGYKVAVCEQIEDPKTAKGLVARAVTRVVTPGTLSDEQMLDDKTNNYLAVFCHRDMYAMAFCDISTGEVYAAQTYSPSTLINEAARYSPREILIDEAISEELGETLGARFTCGFEIKDTEFFIDDGAVASHFGADSADSLGSSGISALAGLMHYLMHTQKNSLSFINTLNVYNVQDYVELDLATRRNLEICETMRDKTKQGTLLWVLDKTKTSMGARLLKQWLEHPLLNPIEINKRLYSVSELRDNAMLRGELASALDGIYDISRILTRVQLHSVSPRDMASLRESLSKLPEIKYILSRATSAMLSGLYSGLDIMDDVFERLYAAVYEQPSISLNDGKVIAPGYSPELDELRDILENGSEYLEKTAEAERERTGIKNLKVHYNKVFGYYIEVTNTNRHLVPEDYIRKQTLVNSERYITPQLKEFEEKMLTASERAASLEAELFEQLRDMVSAEAERLKSVCSVLSQTDVLVSLAEVAAKYNYTMPEISQKGDIIIKDGRHPVVERIQRNVVFVPNDTMLDCADNRLIMITGPNMAGKSTYMRQNALIVLMAQIGSFVPASYAQISVVDRIFTRVGASDDIAQGQSTFMLEMVEVANILKNATRNSLIILDEIGRGTSTFDGLSIAWAVSEFVADKKKLGAKTLFATHYHELCALEDELDGVKNYSIAVKKRGEDITFLRKIVRGGTDDSFGIEVAALAGVPKEVVRRAKQILARIEEGKTVEANKKSPAAVQSSQFGFGDAAAADLCAELAGLDATTFTPIEALNKLYELSNRAKEI